ncbi:MAG: XTP/dITP diphosphatase [Desulfobacterales bacterium]|nr:XTP/dITP diphosphatase [Desulfobacterales bacterium]
MDLPLIMVIATRNSGKTDEIRALLRDFPIEIRNLDDFGPIPEVVEDGTTFEENAYKKASFTARVLGVPALADDSGLVVPALNGAPGVHSARYAGPDATDAERCAKLLKAMEKLNDRRAAFECVISIAVPGGAALTYESRCEGEITRAPHGTNGFGYDPVFRYPPLGRTFAELTRDEKGTVSHRGKALNEVRKEFDKIRIWIRQQMPTIPRSGCASAS